MMHKMTDLLMIIILVTHNDALGAVFAFHFSALHIRTYYKRQKTGRQEKEFVGRAISLTEEPVRLFINKTPSLSNVMVPPFCKVDAVVSSVRFCLHGALALRKMR
jgi:hypothetical protein